MINKLISYTYLALVLAFLYLFFSYYMSWIEILETINKGSYLFGILVFLSVVLISKKSILPLKITANLIALLAFLIWTFSLLKLIDFEIYAKISFYLLVFSLVLATYFKLYDAKIKILKISYFIITLYLLTIISLVPFSFFSSYTIVFIPLFLFTILTFYLLYKKIVIN